MVPKFYLCDDLNWAECFNRVKIRAWVNFRLNNYSLVAILLFFLNGVPAHTMCIHLALNGRTRHGYTQPNPYTFMYPQGNLAVLNVFLDFLSYANTVPVDSHDRSILWVIVSIYDKFDEPRWCATRFSSVMKFYNICRTNNLYPHYSLKLTRMRTPK